MSAKIPKHFGPLVRRTREAKGITLRSFAKMIGLSPTYVSKFEMGDFAPPAVDSVKKIAEVLGLDFDELVGKAGRLPPDVEELVQKRPELHKLLRAAATLSAVEFSVLMSSPLLNPRKRKVQPDCTPMVLEREDEPDDDDLPIGA